MSNSSLISFTKLSPNRNSPRTHKIDTITIHTMAGNMMAENCATMFSNPLLRVSSNYAIGSNGTIALIVNESDRSWCSSNTANDDRAITIEVASLTNYEPFDCSVQAMESLISLCADICKRNGIDALRWKADKSLIGQPDKQNMTVHRWFAAKSCPGDYLYSKMGEIADKVNERLKGLPPVVPSNMPYLVKCISPVVNIRSGPGTTYKDVGDIIDTCVSYTIINERKAEDGKLWGMLKSGAGWVLLDFFKKV